MTSELSLEVRVPDLTSPGEGQAGVSGTVGCVVGTVPAERWGEWMRKAERVGFALRT